MIGGGFFREISFIPVLMLLFGLGMSTYLFVKARAYDRAYDAYRARRRQLMRGRS